MKEISKPHILVLGGGFAGVEFCKRIDLSKFDVTLVDRQNHHLFQPLLYQVASSGLAVPEIAQPIRMILSRKNGLRILMDDAQKIDLTAKRVEFSQRPINYDVLVLALGAVTSYFGNDHWERYAPGLKTVKDAARIRQSTLYAFEKAENSDDPEEQKKLLTTVVIGGGPTGVELAGAFAELARHTLAKDFLRINPKLARVILIEAAGGVLNHMPADLSQAAKRQLEKMGVEIRLNTMVKDIRDEQVILEDETIEAANILWTAGVSANPITKSLGIELARGNRIPVKPDLSVPEHPEVFALGDIVSLKDANGVLVPGVSPAALQMARHTAKLLNQGCLEKPVAERPAFAYRDKGTMATIGRSKAVAQTGKLKLTGFIAWLAWLLVHLVFLIGFRNKVVVIFQWMYSYITYRKGARIIHSAESAKKRFESPEKKQSG